MKKYVMSFVMAICLFLTCGVLVMSFTQIDAFAQTNICRVNQNIGVEYGDIRQADISESLGEIRIFTVERGRAANSGTYIEFIEPDTFIFKRLMDSNLPQICPIEFCIKDSSYFDMSKLDDFFEKAPRLFLYIGFPRLEDFLEENLELILEHIYEDSEEFLENFQYEFFADYLVDYYAILNRENPDFTETRLRSINSRIERIAQRPEDREFEPAGHIAGHMRYIWAVIDGKMYWSLFAHDPHCVSVNNFAYINPDLLMLVHELAQLADWKF